MAVTVTNHLCFLSPWGEDQSTSNDSPILLFSLFKTSLPPDERVGGILIMASWDSSLSATFTSFGGHNTYWGLNCRFCNGWTDGQTEFTVINSPNVTADDLALHAGDEIKKNRLCCNAFVISGLRWIVQIKVVMLKLFPTLIEHFFSQDRVSTKN